MVFGMVFTWWSGVRNGKMMFGIMEWCSEWCKGVQIGGMAFGMVDKCSESCVQNGAKVLEMV